MSSYFRSAQTINHECDAGHGVTLISMICIQTLKWTNTCGNVYYRILIIMK